MSAQAEPRITVRRSNKSIGRDQKHRVTEPTGDRRVEDRHRDAGAAVVAANHPVDKQVLRLGKIDFPNAIRIVINLEILL